MGVLTNNEWAFYDAWEERSMDTATRNAVREGCKQSAAAVLPVIFDTLGLPGALLDVGAGEGHWTTAAMRLGVKETHAVDLESHNRYGCEVWEWDASIDTLPLWHGKDKWPLVLCLEMAEHVDENTGLRLVADLCRAAELVVWSAAIPGQGGDGHINEQWPGYWQAEFELNDYTFDDPWRDTLWHEDGVEPWYAQNILLAYPSTPGSIAVNSTARALVHPVTWAHHRGVPAPGV